ncbi:MAG: thiamine phosphate synthase [Methanomassiliicoccaceae archaeon]|nr:thiamine phosphate synthase [Methanomassiliicoccaceae archaeon]
MIIAITDRRISAAHDFLDQVEAVAAARPDMIILREKDVSEAEYRYLAVECARICGQHRVDFCVNTFIKAAAAIGDGRVQVSFGTLGAEKDRLRGFEEVWVSVHSPSEAVAAEDMGATHLIYGNVFETSCKPGAVGKGVAELGVVCAAAGVPVFAVGGMDVNTISKVVEAGCAGVCIRGLLMASRDPSEVMGRLRAAAGGQ